MVEQETSRSALPLVALAWVGAAGAGYLAWTRATAPPDTATIAARARAELVGMDAILSDVEDPALPADGSDRPSFCDVTLESGVLSIHDWDATEGFRLPEPLGPGVGLLDFDGDGQLDIFVAAGGALPPAAPTQRSQLWSRDAAGRYREVAKQAAADVPGPAYGVACADYDADGDTDLFVTRLGSDVLLRNDRGRFVDVTAEAGVGGDGSFGCSASFFDYDRDGDLDLYVVNYVNWQPAIERECVTQGRRNYCLPTVYEAPSEDRLYRNEGDGRFVDVTRDAGIAGHLGNGLGVIALDFDMDGWDDLYVANDVSPAFLWHNQQDGTFAEVALERGAAFSGAGVAISGMGVVAGDIDEDGRPDLLVTNIEDQSHLALLSRGTGYYDGSARLGLGRWSIPATAFGVVLFDQDHDGQLDLYVGNGSIQLGAPEEGRAPMAEDDHFARLQDGRFVDVTEGSGALEGTATRAVARGDLDGDGDEDLVLSATGGVLSILRNEQPGTNHWLAIDAVTASGSAAIGATIEATVGGRLQRRRVRPQESYLSSSSPRVHIGLGAETSVDELIVVWPDGERTTIEDVPVDQVLEVRRDA